MSLLRQPVVSSALAKSLVRHATSSLGAILTVVYDQLYKLLAVIERQILTFSLVPLTAFIDSSTFPWTARLDNAAATILEEIEAALAEGVTRPSITSDITDTPTVGSVEWRPIFIFCYGEWWGDISTKCPQTVSLLQSIPDLTSAFLGVLDPGGVIPPHRGLWRGQLRYSLGLRVPRDAASCALNVGGITQHWRKGEGMLFDDGFIHSAENLTTEPRVVLLVTVLRPFREPFNTVNRTLFWCIGRFNAKLPDSSRGNSTSDRRFRTWLPGSPNVRSDEGNREERSSCV